MINGSACPACGASAFPAMRNPLPDGGYEYRGSHPRRPAKTAIKCPNYRETFVWRTTP